MTSSICYKPFNLSSNKHWIYTSFTCHKKGGREVFISILINHLGHRVGYIFPICHKEIKQISFNLMYMCMLTNVVFPRNVIPQISHFFVWSLQYYCAPLFYTQVSSDYHVHICILVCKLFLRRFRSGELTFIK